MPKLDERDARIRVFTFKEGLLSAVAHDLEIEASRVALEWSDDERRITAVIDARGLRVLHAVLDARPAPDALSDRDKRKIEQTIADEVLHAARHPNIRFEGELTWPSDTTPAVSGTLSLHGRTLPVPIAISQTDGDWVATARLHQPDFGITPYSAMLGTLRIRPDVRVEVRVAQRHRRPR